MFSSRIFRRTCTATLLLTITAACGRGELTLPETSSASQLAVDASAAWAYVDLAAGATTAQTTATTSPSWDIGFNATSVALNGGASGPAGVVGYCICRNASATNDQILRMTPENQADAFTSVTAAAIPPAPTSWSSDVFATNRWYRYDLAGDHRISPPSMCTSCGVAPSSTRSS